MRILLDESVPRQLKKLLDQHDVVTVVERGWGSIKNGELLSRAAVEFDVLLTADQGVPHQQNLASYDIAVVVLVAKTNTMVDYESLAARLRSTVANARAREASWVSA